jgi:hypothetical protein
MIASWRVTASSSTVAAIEGLGVDHTFLGFTAPTGDGGQLADVQLEAIARDATPCPGTPI